MTKLLTAHFDEPKLHELETFRRLGGYEGLKKALAMGREALMAEMNKSNLRGLGGAGFGAAMKWSTVPPESKNPGPRYVVVNCDESEPGCFKDRVLVTRIPHQLIEGLLIAAYAIDAQRTFIFIRGEYEVQYKILQKALDEARAAGLIGETSSARLLLPHRSHARRRRLHLRPRHRSPGDHGGQEGLAAPAAALPDRGRAPGPPDRGQ